MSKRILVAAILAVGASVLVVGLAAGKRSEAVQLRGADSKHGVEVPVSVINQTKSAVKVDVHLAVERSVSGKWVALDPSTDGLRLRPDCTGPGEAKCVTIAAGARFDAAPWLATHGDAQCICEKCGHVPPGAYRYVGKMCDGTALPGIPFEIR